MNESVSDDPVTVTRGRIIVHKYPDAASTAFNKVSTREVCVVWIKPLSYILPLLRLTVHAVCRHKSNCNSGVDHLSNEFVMIISIVCELKLRVLNNIL